MLLKTFAVLYYVAINVISGVDCVRSDQVYSAAVRFFKSRNIFAINSFLCDNYEIKSLISLTARNYENSTGIFETSVFRLQRPAGHLHLRLFKAQHHPIGVIINLECDYSDDILRMVSDNRFINGSFVYAIISSDPFETVLKKLDAFKIEFDSEMTIFTDYKLYDVYGISQANILTSSQIGFWTEDGAFEVTSKPRRTDLKGAMLKGTTVVKEFDKALFKKKEFYDPHYKGALDSLSRTPSQMHLYLERFMNFRTNLTISPDWGYPDPLTGKFDESSMYGDLGNERVDFGLTASWMFAARLRTAKFMPTTHQLRSVVVFRHPPAGASFDAFARPFNLSTWLVIFLTLIVASSSLFVMRRLSGHDIPPIEPQYVTSLLQVTAVICLQGTYISSIKLSTRILSVFLQIMSLVVYSYYAAEILGFLLSPSPRTITTVEKLFESHMDLWAENLSFHRNHFRAGVGAKATQYYNVAISGPTPDQDRFIDRTVGMKMVQKGNTALYGIMPTIFGIISQMFSSSEICSVYYMDMLSIQCAVAVQKRSPYREMYTKAVIWFIESGLNDYNTKQWYAQKPPCVGTEDNVAVKLEATFLGQIVYLSGLIASVTFFIIEKCFPPGKFEKVLVHKISILY